MTCAKRLGGVTYDVRVVGDYLTLHHEGDLTQATSLLKRDSSNSDDDIMEVLKRVELRIGDRLSYTDERSVSTSLIQTVLGLMEER